MAEFQKVLEEKKRMCERSMCNKCPLGTFVTNVTTCDKWMLRHPKEAEDYIMKWSAEHPKKTNRMKFEEVFNCCIATHGINEAIPGRVKILNVSDEMFEDWLNAEYNGER